MSCRGFCILPSKYDNLAISLQDRKSPASWFLLPASSVGQCNSQEAFSDCRIRNLRQLQLRRYCSTAMGLPQQFYIGYAVRNQSQGGDKPTGGLTFHNQSHSNPPCNVHCTLQCQTWKLLKILRASAQSLKTLNLHNVLHNPVLCVGAVVGPTFGCLLGQQLYLMTPNLQYTCTVGAVVGPTFGCLLGQQFQILKKGDRFWYENNIPPSAFTKGQWLAS